MSENQIVERVKLLLNRSPVDTVTTVYPIVSGPVRPTTIPPDVPVASPELSWDTSVVPQQPTSTAEIPDEALHMLQMAHRTAEEHIATANVRAEQMLADAESAVQRIHHDAEAAAEEARTSANNMLAAARAAAEQTGRDAHDHAAEVRRQIELELAEARGQAERIVAEGQVSAEETRQRARRQYDDAVGGLAVKREVLQQQIEALEAFDADYRSRLTSLLQSQLRALWADRPDSAAVANAGATDSAEPGDTTEPA